MNKTTTGDSDSHKSHPLNLPLGQVYITKEAMDALFASSISLDDVLQWHATGYGGDGDHDYNWDNYELAERGGPNLSLHDLEAEDDDGEPLQLKVVTPRDRSITIVSIHTGAE